MLHLTAKIGHIENTIYIYIYISFLADKWKEKNREKNIYGRENICSYE